MLLKYHLSSRSSTKRFFVYSPNKPYTHVASPPKFELHSWWLMGLGLQGVEVRAPYPCASPTTLKLRNHFRFLGHWPPTPALIRHQHLLLTWGKIVTQGRGRWSVTWKPQMTVQITTDNACKLQTNSSKFRVNSFDIRYQCVMKNQRRLLYTTKGENKQRSRSNLVKFVMQLYCFNFLLFIFLSQRKNL